MRGALRAHRRLAFDDGIIPADAGSTVVNASAARSIGDHPRGCGEHDDFSRFANACEGSSPRMRGALDHLLVDSTVAGIIPADAGSTVEDRFGHEIIRDHPRGCGEH